jgi:hypothetical protein
MFPKLHERNLDLHPHELSRRLSPENLHRKDRLDSAAVSKDCPSEHQNRDAGSPPRGFF